MTKTARERPPGCPPSTQTFRLLWLDAMKGVSMIWIAVFHCFLASDTGHYPWPLDLSRMMTFIRDCGAASIPATFGCTVEALVAALFQRGPQPVGVFILLSGFGLTYGLTRTGEPDGGWGRWYWRRLLRLYPMYWIAHLVYLISPFVHRQDPLDYRFVLSFLGDRVVPVDKIFFYVNPSWWFFGLLIELYLVFPLLYKAMRRFGPAKFLVFCGLFTVFSRYLLFGVLEASGNYIQGAFFGARLWEFAVGMAGALLYRQRPSAVEGGLFSSRALVAGVVIYVLGLYAYQPNFLYAFSDGLVATGLFVILAHLMRWILCNLPRVGSLLTTVGVFSYGIFLLHQPYVIYVGQRLRGASLLSFTVVAALVIAAISIGSIFVERHVNRLTSRLLDRFDRRPSPSHPT
ncbi:MAG: acyltransferase [Syntrophobacteraceae bacterium]